MNNPVFVTMNPKLEQFLYMHKIRFISQRKREEDLLTEWTYLMTPRLKEVIAEFREIWQ